MKKTFIYTLMLLSSFVLTAQRIEKYNGKVFVDIDNKKVQAEYTITFSTLSDGEKLKLFLTKSANISNISSNARPVSYEITEKSFIGHDKAIVIDKKGIEN